MEQGRLRLWNRGYGAQPVNFSEERCIFTPPPMNDSNFGVDENGKTVLLGLGRIAFLPESFASWNLSEHKDILGTFGWSRANISTMCKVAHNLAMTADPSLSKSTYT